MLTYDITALLENALASDRRPPDGKLHPSGDLLGSLRHSQLRAAGAPTVESEIVSDIRLMTGTMWHSYFEDLFRKNRLPVMAEVKLDPWLPEGWSGTADWIVWNPEYRAFVLNDLKSIKGEGMKWVLKDGIKAEHQWQVSSYWYALERMGLPLVKGYGVYYLPMNAAEDAAPSYLQGMPLDKKLVLGTMEDRWRKTELYLGSLPKQASYLPSGDPVPLREEQFLTDHLAPVQDRVQVTRWNKTQGVFDVKLTPHWSAAFCPFPPKLCDCREQSTTKIGHYTLDACEHVGENYVVREGYEDIFPTAQPTPTEFTKRQKENA